MEGSNFLKNLKNAVDTGEFNSEAAKKIIEIDKLADVITPNGNAEELIEKRLNDAGAKIVTEEEAAALNADYENKMILIKKQDTINKQLATLIDIEDMVKASIEDMISFTDGLESQFEKEFEGEDPMFGELHEKIEQIKSKYSSIINN